MWQGEKVPKLPPSLLEWKGHGPTTTNISDENIFERGSDEYLLWDLTLAGEMYKWPTCMFEKDGKGFRSNMGH